MERIGVILNPHSRKNRLQKRSAGEWQASLGGLGRCVETQSIAEIRPALKELLEWGATILVADGGDGALGWVINETLSLVRSGEVPREDVPPFLPSSSGRVNFVARKAGLSSRPSRNLQALAARTRRGDGVPTIALDSLWIEGVHRSGEPFRHLGFAVAAGGVGQRFFDKFYRLRDPSAGKIAWIVGLAVGSYAASHVPLRATKAWSRYGEAIFAPTRARVVIDGHELPDRTHGAIHAGAFDLKLGPFHVFPLAHQPNVLHFQAGGIDPSEIVRAIPALCLGRRIPSERLVEVQGKEMRVEALDDELLGPVIDGEIFRDLKELVIRGGPPIPIAVPFTPRGLKP